MPATALSTKMPVTVSEAGELEDDPSDELLELEELLTELTPSELEELLIELTPSELEELLIELTPSELEELLKELLLDDFEPDSPPQAPTNNVGNKISNNFR